MPEKASVLNKDIILFPSYIWIYITFLLSYLEKVMLIL